MPQLLEHIDAISRKKQRDVLSLSFFPVDQTYQNGAHDAPGFWEQWAKDF